MQRLLAREGPTYLGNTTISETRKTRYFATRHTKVGAYLLQSFGKIDEECCGCDTGGGTELIQQDCLCWHFRARNKLSFIFIVFETNSSMVCFLVYRLQCLRVCLSPPSKFISMRNGDFWSHFSILQFDSPTAVIHYWNSQVGKLCFFLHVPPRPDVFHMPLACGNVVRHDGSPEKDYISRPQQLSV